MWTWLSQLMDARNPYGLPRDPQWESLEKATVKAQPFCSCCGATDKLEVHHILPFAWPGGRVLELVKSNLVVLCRPCHFLFGHLKDWKSCNPSVVADAAAMANKIQQRPYPKKAVTTMPISAWIDKDGTPRLQASEHPGPHPGPPDANTKAIVDAIAHLTNVCGGINQSLHAINHNLERIADCVCHKVVDLGLVIQSQSPSTKGSVPMAHNKKAHGPAVKCPCLAPKGSKPKAVMSDVNITDPAPKSITLQPLDINGGVVTLSSTDSVIGTLVSDNDAALAITAGADTLNYVGTIPANTPMGSVANLAATLKGTIQNAPADLSASVKVTINIPPSPVAVDLAIVFA